MDSTTSGEPTGKQAVGLGDCLTVLLMLLTVVAATLFPWHFFLSADGDGFLDRFLAGWAASPGGLAEFLANILFFVPVGFGLTAFLAQPQVGTAMTTGKAVAVALSLSLGIETAQVFLPSRFSTVRDLTANGVGGCIGCLLFWRYGAAPLWWVSRTRVRAVNALAGLTRQSLLAAYVLYITAVFFVSVPLQRATGVTNWDDSFSLVVGNERTGDRQWQGQVSRLAIAGSAMNESEAARVFRRGSQHVSFGPYALGSYGFSEFGSSEDELGLLPPLRWSACAADAATANAVRIREGRWLESASAGAQVTRAIVSAGQFTVSVWLTAQDLAQSGPARIVSISADPLARNLTLGQEGDSLVVRLRTPLTGENGQRPELVAPGVFAPGRVQHILVTYDGAVLSLFVDGRRHAHALEMGPGAAVAGQFARLNPYDLRGFNWLYLLIALGLPGAVVGVIVQREQLSLAPRALAIAVGTVVPALALEAMLHRISGQPIGAEDLSIGPSVALGSALVSMRALHHRALKAAAVRPR